jgi:hypothetical protein
MISSFNSLSVSLGSVKCSNSLLIVSSLLLYLPRPIIAKSFLGSSYLEFFFSTSRNSLGFFTSFYKA